MPLVHIAHTRARDTTYDTSLGDIVHAALVATMNVPAEDRFQIVGGAGAAQILYAPEYLGITHTDAIVIVQITLNAGRTVEQKRALYAKIAADLAAAHGIPRGDVIISLIEVVKENWSFGDGQAQYAT